MYYSHESLQNIFERHNNFRNTLLREIIKSADTCQWLDPNDPGREMTDRKKYSKNKRVE